MGIVSIDLGAAERTVGAALRGRPWFGMVFAKSRPCILELLLKPRAATEGRPYSTFRRESIARVRVWVDEMGVQWREEKSFLRIKTAAWALPQALATLR